jgi:hypothetical protein
VKQEDSSFLFREFFEYGVEGAEAFTTNSVVVGRQADGFNGWGQFIGGLGTTSAGASVHEHDVDGKAMEPSGEAGVAPEVFDTSKNVNEGFLNEVFEISFGAEHTEDETSNIGAMFVVQLAVGGGVSSLAAGNELMRVELRHE